MRHIIAKKLHNPLTNSILDNLSIGSSAIFFRNFSSKRYKNNLLEYFQITKFDKKILQLNKKLRSYPKGTIIDLKKESIFQILNEDILSEDSGQIVIASEEDITIRYGKRGISAAKNTSTRDLLKDEIKIQGGYLGVLEAKDHVPILIEALNPERVLALASCQISPFPEYEENISRYSLTKVIEIPPGAAKILAVNFQKKIFEDEKKESFYEEITSKSYLPSKYNRSSGTLMNFELEDATRNIGKTTATHFHPGERSLYIFTINKPAGVILNFCGINENPDLMLDHRVELNFPPNSMIVLNFPSFTHHKFYGEFVCMSIHPREGNNLIEAVQSGNLPSGFLESATFFSKTTLKEDEPWKLSKPNQSSKTTKNHNR